MRAVGPSRWRKRTRALGAATILAASWIGAPSSARAYRTFADDPDVGYPARWEGAVEWDLSTAELGSATVDADALELAARRAFAAWEAAPCEPFHSTLIAVQPAGAAPGDGRSTIQVVASDWSVRGFPSGRGATTDVQLERAADGTFARIVEADVYLNFADFRFTLGAPGEGELGLEPVLRHEISHLLGMLHPCEIDGAGGAPDCASSSAYLESSIYPEYLGDVGPSPDDLAGMCELYASASRPCEPACGDDSVCRDGACVPIACGGTSCVGVRCAGDGTCTEGVCGVAGDATGFCVAPGEIGAPCSVAAECSTRLCLTSMSAGSYCTVSCADDSDCPGMQRCAAVEAMHVCAPMVARSGCAVGAHDDGPATMLALATVVAVARFRRRRR